MMHSSLTILDLAKRAGVDEPEMRKLIAGLTELETMRAEHAIRTRIEREATEVLGYPLDPSPAALRKVRLEA